MTINGYEIELTLNNSEAEEFDYRSISFSLRDSIYSLYCSGTFSIHDPSGYFLEARAFSEGVPLDLSFGILGELLSNSYFTHGMEVKGADTALQLSGKIETGLTHISAKEHECLSRSFDPVPSDIIKELYDHVFEDTFIEATKAILPEEKKIFQPRMNQEDFINRVLLPNSLSNEKTPSPFYCFIDSMNQLHYESYMKMYDRSPLATLYLNREKKIDSFYQKILSFIPFTFDARKHNKIFDFSIEGFTDEETPQYEKSIQSIIDYGDSPYPVYNYPTEVQPWDNGFQNRTSEQVQANILFKQRNAICPDKILVTVPLHTDFCSGQTVNIDVEYVDMNTSYSYEGKYLIERSDHVWDGETMSGYTQLVLGRKSPSFNPDSELERGMKK